MSRRLAGSNYLYLFVTVPAALIAALAFTWANGQVLSEQYAGQVVSVTFIPGGWGSGVLTQVDSTSGEVLLVEGQFAVRKGSTLSLEKRLVGCARLCVAGTRNCHALAR